MQSVWRFLRRVLGPERPSRRRSRGPSPPLRILRLERRRVLSADFTLGATGLILDGFDSGGGETLSISQLDSEYRFTLSNGSWTAPASDAPEGIAVDGQTLAIKTALVDQLVEGLTIVGNRSTPLNVTLDQADFSSLQGSLNFVGIRSVDQVEGTEVALSSSGSMQIMAPQTGMSIGSLNVAGNLTILSFGAITDGDGTQINVTGNATFISRAFHPAGDFDNSGEVTNADYDIWAANFGLSSGATKAQGDANGDGAVDLADYSVWRDTLGQVYAPGGIFLADNAADQLTVGGKATFEAQEGTTRFDIDVGAMGTTNFGSLVVIGANVDVQEDSSTELMGVDAGNFSLTSAGAITDSSGTTINVSGLATFNAGANAITLGDNAADTTNFGQLHLTGGAITVTEDSSTVLTGVTAASLDLTSNGPITDAAGTTISVIGLAKFNAGANDITLGDNAADTTNFGQLNLTGGVVTVTEDSGTELTGVSASVLNLTSAGAITEAGTMIIVAGDANFISGGAITLSDNAADVLSVGGLATFRAGAVAPFFNITIGPAGLVNFGQLHLTGAAVTIQEDSATVLTHVTATTLHLTSTGSITDADGTTISVTGLATFNAGANPITLGNHAADVTNFGQLRLTGSAVSMTEDSATELTGVSAASLQLISAGAIGDAPAATINVTGVATFQAGGAILLANNATDTLSVGGLATFRAGIGAPFSNIAIGAIGAVNFGQLHLTGDTVTVQEDSATVLTGVTATSLNLASNGSITDASGTTINVTGLATFNAGANPITLGNHATDETNFGQVNLTGTVVMVQEDSPTELTGLVATEFVLDSAGAITDSSTANMEVTGPASLTADGKITLADAGPANSFIVHALASFVVTDGYDIDIGVIPASGLPALANAQLGSLQFTAIGGEVRVALDGPIILSGNGSGGASAAAETDLETTLGSGGEVALNDLTTGRLGVNSDAAIVDAADSDVVVSGLAVLTAKTFITLADSGGGNRFNVAQHASFASTGGGAIDLGVVPEADPTSTTRGIATDAVLELGSFSFVSEHGNFTANLDNSVVLAELSLAGSAWIQSAGAITDAFGADTIITEFAILQAANGQNIILGDDAAPGDTRFRMETPAEPLAVFDATRFLAMKAENVSIQVDSSVNLSTNPDFNEFPGTVFLAAEGNISQVGHDGAIEPLEANRIAMLSAAAVLFSQVRVKSQVTTDDSTAPNLAIRGGTPLPISVLPAGEFPVDFIPSSTIRSTSPIGFDPGGVEMPRPDGSGLNDLTGARILEPSAIGDDYSIIMKVLGDAKVGIVHDATGVQASLVGVEVTDASGNAFLQTVADAAEVGDIVFSSMDAPTSTTVRIHEGVFTAVAAGELTIDTDLPGEADAPGLRTTRLTSDTGTVTSVEAYTTFDGGPPSATLVKVGPRMIVDAPHENQDAATTGLVFSPDFEQRITLVAGSRGENNLILEMEWADVQTPRDGGPPLGPGVDGTIPFPEVAYVPESVDGQPSQPFIQSSVPPLDFRAVTVRHNYAGEFIPDNPALPQLPTTIRLYNDPSINLYDQGGARNLNVAENFVSPRVINDVVAGYTEPLQPTPPAQFITVDRPVATVVVTVPQSRAVVDEIRVSTASGVESIWYGRVDENGEFISGPGEEWPVPAEEYIEGDRLNEIRDKINNSTAPEGVYRIISRTPRSDQLLDEWVKGDAVEESEQEAENGEVAPEEQEQQTPEDATNDGDEGASVALPMEQVSDRRVVPETAPVDVHSGPSGDVLIAGQLVVGAAIWAIGRKSGARTADDSTVLNESQMDLSRASRRRRKWNHLLRRVPPPQK